MDLNPDFSDLLRNLEDANVRYLVVGAYAYAFHVEPRYTKDLDVWVDPEPGNAKRVWEVLRIFGAPVKNLKAQAFEDPNMIFQIGVENNRIDIITAISGVSFESAWPNRVKTKFGSVPLKIIGKADLIRNKKAAGRPQDSLDVAKLTKNPNPKMRRKRKRS